MNLFSRFRKFSVECWCGAQPGERCRDREGRTSPLHDSRGVYTRHQMNIFLKAAGLPPLEGEE